MEIDLESRTSMVLKNEVLKEIIDVPEGVPVYINGVPAQHVYDPKTAPPEKGSGIKAALFLIFFIGAIIAAAVFSQTEPVLCVSAIGSIFLFIGLSLVFQDGLKLENFMALIVPVAGLLMTGIPILMVYGRTHPDAIQITRNDVIKLAVAGMGAVGVMIAVLTPIANIRERARCSQPVMAKCIYRLFRFKRSSRSVGTSRTYRIFCPVWQYEADGAVYVTSEGVYSGENVPEIFDEQQIYYQPGKPYNILRPLKSAWLVPVLVGAAFAGASVITLVMMNK